MRVFVTYDEEKLVVPVKDPSERVSSLLKTISERFSSHLGKQVRFVSLNSRGFLLSKTDIIEEVIRDSDNLDVIDYEAFVETQKQLLGDVWLSISEPDFLDKTSKYAKVGIHKHNKLYICLGETTRNETKMKAMELFSIGDLSNFAKDGRVLVSRIEGSVEGLEWFIEAHVHVKSNNVKTVELSIKTTNDKIAHREQVEINFDADKQQLSKGETKFIERYLLKPKKEYTIPKTVSKGPKLTPKPKEEEKEEKFQPVKSKGESKLTFEQIDKVYPDQSYTREGSFEQFFYSEFLVTNTGETPLSIKSVSGEMQTQGGKWTSVTTRPGYKRGYYYYSWNYEDVVNLECPEKKGIKLAFSNSWKIEGYQIDRHRRAHSSLKMPIRFRIKVIDSEGKESSFEFTYEKNPPLDIMTKETKEKDARCEILLWVECDDLVSQERLWCFLGKEKKGDMYWIYQQGSGCGLSPRTLRELGFQGMRENKDVMPLDSPKMNHHDGKFKGSGSLLIDKENGYPYAIKLSLQTTTSATTEYFKIPESFINQH